MLSSRTRGRSHAIAMWLPGLWVSRASEEPCRQALIYLRWIRWIMTEALPGRDHVFVNMDETLVSKIAAQSSGFVPSRQVQKERHMVRKKLGPDRHDVRTSLLGTVCNDPALQPFLPQVFLPCYSKHVVPPMEVLGEYRRSRGPLEYWHNTNGWSSGRLIQRWLTRLRSIISSVRPGAWIIVVLDCATSHLHAEVLRHARRMSLLMLIIPAGLTFIFQVLDAYIYADLKRSIRRGLIRHTSASPGGVVQRLARIRCTAAAVHETLVQVDCSEYFRRVGLAEDFNALSEDASKIVGQQIIAPALPLRAEFATMIARPPHTDVTRLLHQHVLSGWLHLRTLPLGAGAPPGAHVHLPVRDPARRRGRDLPQDRPVLWDDVRMARFRRLHRDSAMAVPEAEEAVNVFLDV